MPSAADVYYPGKESITPHPHTFRSLNPRDQCTPMDGNALQETFMVAWDFPDEVRQIASWDGSRRAESETDLATIEREFLREIIPEQQAEWSSNVIEEGAAQESEWRLFLENLSPQTPRECSKSPAECGLPNERRLNSGNSPPSSEWDALLDRLAQMETAVVQKILGHVESDVLHGMLRFLHLRTIRDTAREPHREERPIPPVPKAEAHLINSHTEPVVQDAPPETPTQSFEVEVWDLDKQLDSDSRWLPKEDPFFERRHATMDCLRWPPENPPKHHVQPTCYFSTDNGGEPAFWDPIENASHQAESKAEGALQKFRQRLAPQKRLPTLFERSESDQEDVLEPLLQKMESGSELDLKMESESESNPGCSEAALQGVKQKQAPQSMPQKLTSEGESDHEEADKELPQNVESEPEAGSQESHIEEGILNSDFRQTCSKRIESKLAEIPTQIASTLFMRTPERMDSTVLLQLFRQIDNILIQVMPHQILFDSFHPPKNIATRLFDHLPWHVPPNCFKYTEFNKKLNELELLNPQLRRRLHSADTQQRPYPQTGFTNGFSRTELEPMPLQGNQSLNYRDWDSDIQSRHNGSCLWSAVYECFPTVVPNHLQLLPSELMSDSTTLFDNLRCPQRDALSIICSRADGGPWNPSLIVRESPSSSAHRLDKLPQPEAIDDDHNKLHLLPCSDVLLSERSEGIDSSHDPARKGLPQEQQEQQQQQQQQAEEYILLPEADVDMRQLLLPQSFMEIPFPLMDPVELHSLRQKTCLTVLQQIAKQVEYSISQGLPLEIDAGLLEALDLQPQDYWLQTLSGGEPEASDSYFRLHHPETSWEVQEVDFDDSDGSPNTSQPTDNSNEFRELHDDMLSTSGWTTEPSESGSPRYYMADPITKVYRPCYSYKDVDVDGLGQPIRHEFEGSPGQSVPEAMMPLYAPPHDILEDVRHNIDMATRGVGELDDRSDASPDFMSSLNLLWVPEQDLQQQQQSGVTQQEPEGDEMSHAIDFYMDGLAGNRSDLMWVLNSNDNPASAEQALQNEEDAADGDITNDFVFSGDLQGDDELSGSSSSTGHRSDPNEGDGFFVDGTDSSSWSSQSQETETLTPSSDEPPPPRNSLLACCEFCQPQPPEFGWLQGSPLAGLPQERNSVASSPQFASVVSLNGMGSGNSSPASNPGQHNDASSNSSPHTTRSVHCEQRSETSGEHQINRRGSERVPSPGDGGGGGGSGKPRKSHTRSSSGESVPRGPSTSGSPKGSASVVKVSNRRHKSPTLSQFHDPSTPIQHTIFGLLVLAGGLYLVENRDEIELQSMSATEAAAEAWRWLGNFLLKMARGEFDN